MLKNAVQVGILALKNLVDPMGDFDLSVATKFTKEDGALERFVSQRIELAEEFDAVRAVHEVEVSSVLVSCQVLRVKYHVQLQM